MLRSAAFVPLFTLSLPVSAQDMVPATLAGHAALPALSFSAPPANAPEEAWVSGRFTAGTAPVNTPQSLEANGLMRPFFGQPIQGFSAYAFTRDPQGAIYALIDNGFGSLANSSDALLSFTRLVPDFDTGRVEVRARVWLRDPDRKVPFRIVHEATEGALSDRGGFRPREHPGRGRPRVHRRGIRALHDHCDARRCDPRRAGNAAWGKRPSALPITPR